MSTHTPSPNQRTDQQTLYDAAASRRIRQFPKGIILRYEPTKAFNEFLAGNYHVTYVMLNFSDAQRIVEEHGSLYAILERWQVPIVTATEADEVIRNRQRDDIRYLLEHVQPAIYIPDAGTVYWNNQEDSNRRGIRVFKTRLNWLMAEIESQGWDIHVLPLAKGMYRWHYEELRDCYDRHGFEHYAFYTKQYVGGSRGNAICRLERHIQNLIDVMDAKRVFAIARHGATHLRRLPPQVQGASGITQFVANCKSDGQFCGERFVEWSEELEETLLNKSTVIQC